MTTIRISKSDGSSDKHLCCHHWVIEGSSGPVSNGRCRICGEVQQFKNFIESSPEDDDDS